MQVFIKSFVKFLLSFLLICVASNSFSQKNNIINIVYLSDVHYGLTKKEFRNKKNVTSAEVNKAIVTELNNLPNQKLPLDSGVNGNQIVKYIDAVIVTGDIGNREEKGIQSASKSWKEFKSNYIDNLHLKNEDGIKTPLYLTPGNHDASNATGYVKPLSPNTDNKIMVEIYNRMLHPKKLISSQTFNYNQDVPNYSVNLKGIHLLFPSVWPDSANRIWMNDDLKNVKETTPVFIFTHVPPYGDAKLFTNPNTPPTINAKDKFENLLREHYKDGLVIDKHSKDSMEEIGLDDFLYSNPNIKAYFHGHENHNEFYTYRGLDNKLSLPVFRVDSPMKGSISSKDETKCSFQLISIDTNTHLMTVRECLYNALPNSTTQHITWGDSKTIKIN